MEGSVKDNMKDWSLWCGKIIELGKVEATSRPFITKLLESIQGSIDMAKPDGKHAQHMKNCYHVMCVDAYDVACLELLSRLLYPRGFPKGFIFIKHFEVQYSVCNDVCLFLFIIMFIDISFRGMMLMWMVK